ncbi:hypothetical protein Ancab_012022 [Ancistrocladus abbreviatus]
MLSENPVIRNTTGEERPGGPNMMERSSMAVSWNDDNLAKNLRLAAEGGERNIVAERRVEREESVGVQGAFLVDSDVIMTQGPIDGKTQAGNFAYPENSVRELTWGCAFLDLGPACRTNGEAIGPAHSLGQSVCRRVKGGVTCLGQGVHIKPRPKHVGVSSCGPGCSGSSDKPKTTSVEVPSPTGSSKIPREVNGNVNTVCNSHPKSKPHQTGCRKSTMKLGVGPWQRTCGAKKKFKKQKAGSTINRAANSPGASETKTEDNCGSLQGSVAFDLLKGNAGFGIFEADRAL